MADKPRMVRLVSNKPIRMSSLSGVIITFTPGREYYLPEDIANEAKSLGVQELPETAAETPEQVNDRLDTTDFVVSEEVFQELVDALTVIREEGDPEDFTSSGAPKAAVVNRAVNRTVTSEERARAWDIVLAS